MKNIFLKFYITIFLLCSTSILFAQPGSGSDGDSLEGNDTAAPIDDYIWVLAAIGLIFVFMKYRAMKKSRIQG